MKLIQRSERLYEIKMGYVKIFIIKSNNQLALIDTGMAGKGEAILRVIDEAGLDSKQLGHIILTHLHEDHTGSLAELKELTDARVYAQDEDATDIEKGITMRPCIPSPRFPANVIAKLLLRDGKTRVQEGCTVDVRLKGDEFLDIAGGIQILATPGHTKGHICCLLKEEKILIAGDVGNGGLKPGFPFLFEDMEQGIESLRTLGRMDINAAYFSHGKTISREASRKFREAF